MDRATALRILEEVIGIADWRRWERRMSVREALEDATLTGEERMFRLRDAIAAELGSAEEAAELLRRHLQGDANAAGGQDESRHSLGDPHLQTAFAARIQALDTPEAAYEMAVELFEHLADLGDQVTRELAVEVREACARLGGNPQHKRFRALGVDRPVRRSELGMGLAAFAEAPNLTHTPFDTLRHRASGFTPPPPRGVSAAPEAQALEAEIRDNHVFGTWSRRRQRAQLGVWGGRLRHLRATDRIDREGQRIVYELLMKLSRTYRPGHVDAFVLKFEPPDWKAYISEQTALLQSAIAAEGGVDGDLVEGTTTEDALHHLEHLLMLPPSRRHLSWGKQVIVQAEHAAELAGDCSVLAPYADVLVQELEGDGAARSLVRRLRAYCGGDETPPRAANTDSAYGESEVMEAGPELDQLLVRVLPFTRGRHAVLLGGSSCDLPVSRIEAVLEFDVLECVDVAGPSGAPLEALRRRVGHGSVHIVMCVAHSPSDVIDDHRLAEACRDARVPCVVVAPGGGVKEIAATLAEVFGGWGDPDTAAAVSA